MIGSMYLTVLLYFSLLYNSLKYRENREKGYRLPIHLNQPSISIGDRQASISAESSRCDLHTRRGLAAFVFTAIHQAHHILHRLARVTHRHDLFEAAVFFDISAQDGVKQVVGRQRIAILL